MMQRPSLHRGADRRLFRWTVPTALQIWLLALLLLPGINRAAEPGGGVDKVLSLDGIAFHVLCSNQGSLNTLTIVPTGLERDTSAITREIDGSVTGVEVADLNSDGSPEIYVFVNSAGSGSYGTLVACSKAASIRISRRTQALYNSTDHLNAQRG